MSIRKTLQASVFSFIVLNLIKKTVLHFFNDAKIIEERSMKQKKMTYNAELTKGKSCIH